MVFYSTEVCLGDWLCLMRVASKAVLSICIVIIWFAVDSIWLDCIEIHYSWSWIVDESIGNGNVNRFRSLCDLKSVSNVAMVSPSGESLSPYRFVRTHNEAGICKYRTTVRHCQLLLSSKTDWVTIVDVLRNANEYFLFRVLKRTRYGSVAK